MALTQISRSSGPEEERKGYEEGDGILCLRGGKSTRVARGIYAAALIKFPVAIILLYTGRLAAQG